MFDILVIGAGEAGLKVALMSKDKENTVLVVSKDFYNRSSNKDNFYSLQLEAINKKIKFKSEFFLMNFITNQDESEQDTILGATFLNIKTNKIELIQAKSIILASGGYCSVYYDFNTRNNLASGDGIASAVRIGAKFANAELLKFKAITRKDDRSKTFSDTKKLQNYDKKPIIIKEDIAKYIYENSKKHYGIFVLEDDEEIEVMPSAQYSLGGIEVDENGQSNIKRLFVVGECASDNLDLSNYAHKYLSPNHLDNIVKTSLYSKNCAKEVLDENITNIQNHPQILRDKQFVNACFLFPNLIDISEQRKILGELLYENVSFTKDEFKLETTLKKIKQMQVDYTYMGLKNKVQSYNKELIELIEFGNILEIAEMIVISAILKNKNSRLKINKNIHIHKKEKKTRATKMAIFDYDFSTQYI